MLKKKYIPTPLIDQAHHEHRGGKLTAEQLRPVRYRLLYIVLLIFRVQWWLFMIRRRPQSTEYTMLGLARMVRGSMERLGGLWIKAAQIMAMRRDAFPKVFCDELASLHDRAGGFPGEVAKAIIEEELGTPIDTVFKDFDMQPLAAASIGQVHTAVLRDNDVKVAIKVQRLGVAEYFTGDFKIVRTFMGLLNLTATGRWLRLNEMVRMLERTLADELDYRLEFSSMRKMRRSLKEDKIYAPKAFGRYSKKRVLTMEFIDGVLMSDFIHTHIDEPEKAKAWLKENKIKLKKIGERMFLSFNKQFMEDNLLHGDLHPGNIMLLRKNRVAFIDFGSVSTLDFGFVQKNRMQVRAVATRDFGKYVDILLTMVDKLPQFDIDAFKKEVVREFESWEALANTPGVPYAQRSLSGISTKIAPIIGRYKFPPVWTTLRVTRSSVAFDTSMQFLLPEINYFKIMQKHFARTQMRMVQQLASKQTRDKVGAVLNDLRRLPGNFGEDLIFQAELVRKRALSFQSSLSKASEVGRIVLSTMLNIGVIATIFAIARVVAKNNQLGATAVASLPVRDVFASMPHLSPGVWVAVLLLSVYLLHNVRNLIKVLGIAGVNKNPFT